MSWQRQPHGNNTRLQNELRQLVDMLKRVQDGLDQLTTRNALMTDADIMDEYDLPTVADAQQFRNIVASANAEQQDTGPAGKTEFTAQFRHNYS